MATSSSLLGRNAKSDRFAARFWRLPTMVPPNRLDGVLDMLADHLRELLPGAAGIDHNDLIDALHRLVSAGSTSALWRPFASGHGCNL